MKQQNLTEHKCLAQQNKGYCSCRLHVKRQKFTYNASDAFRYFG